MAFGVAQYQFSGSGYWTAPPGFNGPVLVTGFAPSVGTHGVNASTLFVASPMLKYFIDTTVGSIGPAFGSGSTPQYCASGASMPTMTLTWWQPCGASYQIFPSGSWTWHSPIGYDGPVLWTTYGSGSYQSNGSFGPQHTVDISGGAPGNTMPVVPANVSPNTDYPVVVTVGYLIVVWFP